MRVDGHENGSGGGGGGGGGGGCGDSMSVGAQAALLVCCAKGERTHR